MIGWLIRLRNDLWRKRHGFKVVKDAHGGNWWVQCTSRRAPNQESSLTTESAVSWLCRTCHTTWSPAARVTRLEPVRPSMTGSRPGNARRYDNDSVGERGQVLRYGTSRMLSTPASIPRIATP